ncbi:MAG: biotin/lipoate A/B protein ligase family protein [bacterium]
MHYLDLTLPTPVSNLACDEALLNEREAGRGGEVLRVWESPMYFVALGRSRPVRRDVNLGACRALLVPVYRRTSGGGTVLLGPGCLNYSLILRMSPGSSYPNLSETYAAVLGKHQQMINGLLGVEAGIQGISDLTLGPHKFSGNAQRRKKRFMLIHGTFMLNFDLARISRLLPVPDETPDYRTGRPHADFLINLGIREAVLKERLRETWNALEPLEEIPRDSMEEMAAGFLSDPKWIYQF